MRLPPVKGAPGDGRRHHLAARRHVVPGLVLHPQHGLLGDGLPVLRGGAWRRHERELGGGAGLKGDGAGRNGGQARAREHEGAGPDCTAQVQVTEDGPSVVVGLDGGRAAERAGPRGDGDRDRDVAPRRLERVLVEQLNDRLLGEAHAALRAVGSVGREPQQAGTRSDGSVGPPHAEASITAPPMPDRNRRAPYRLTRRVMGTPWKVTLAMCGLRDEAASAGRTTKDDEGRRRTTRDDDGRPGTTKAEDGRRLTESVPVRHRSSLPGLASASPSHPRRSSSSGTLLR